MTTAAELSVWTSGLPGRFYRMKFLASVVLVLMAALAFAVYQAAHRSITIDHLQVSVQRLEKREACLLRLSRSFLATLKPSEVRPWIQANLADLEVHEEGTWVRANEVVFDLSTPGAIE